MGCAGGKTAKSVVENCYKCKLLKKHTLNPKKAPLPADRIGPAPIFNAIAIDLFGPLEYRDIVNKRKTNKSWGVIFVCMATSAIHIELTESYSTDSFLQAFRRFICARGTPSRVVSDSLGDHSWYWLPRRWLAGTFQIFRTGVPAGSSSGTWCLRLANT